jgi:oligoribonuclease
LTTMYMFLDYETTGLNPEKCCPIEVAARVFSPGAEDTGVVYHALIKPAIDAAASSEPQAMAMHVSSGLFEDARDNGRPVKEVEDDLIEIIEKNKGGTWVLAGNSCHFDRAFMSRHMPRLEKLFGHRMLDVSAVRLALRFFDKDDKDPMSVDKKRTHRSIDDLEETLMELRSYKLKER